MKKIAFTISLALCGVGVMKAQEPGNQDFAARFQQIVEERATGLADEFALEGDARTDFIETYKNYRNEQIAAQATPTAPTFNPQEELTDEQATELINSEFDRKAQQVVSAYNVLEIDKKYFQIFSQTLTAKQLIKIFIQQERRGGPGQMGQSGRPGRPGRFGNRQNNNSGNNNGGFGQDNFGGDTDMNSDW